jgi:putative transposase
VQANLARYPVALMCRLLKVSMSGFYAREDRPLSARARADIALTALIHGIHRRSKGAYGVHSIHAGLADDHGMHVGRTRVARLMRAADLCGVTFERFVRTTIADPTAGRAVGLVEW